MREDLIKILNCPKCGSEMEFRPNRIGRNGKLVCKERKHKFAVKREIPILIDFGK